MMRPAQVLGLVLAGVGLIGIGLWLVSRHGPDSAAESTGPVLPLKQADLNAVTRLKIFKGDGSHATLTREATRWVVAERGYAADTGQVRKLLLDLSALQVEEQKTADPALYAKLGVEDPRGAQTQSTGLDIDRERQDPRTDCRQDLRYRLGVRPRRRYGPKPAGESAADSG